MTVSITTFCIKCYYVECHYAKCCNLFIVMLNDYAQGRYAGCRGAMRAVTEQTYLFQVARL